MCNLAVELAMASKASTVDLENSTIQTEMYIEIVRSEMVPLNPVVFMVE